MSVKPAAEKIISTGHSRESGNPLFSRHGPPLARGVTWSRGLDDPGYTTVPRLHGGDSRVIVIAMVGRTPM